MKFIVAMRHWLVFSLLFVLPIAAILILRSWLTLTGDKAAVNPNQIIGPVAAAIICYIAVSGFAWLCGTGAYLHSRLPKDVFLNLPIFYFMTIVPLFWGLWNAWVMLNFYSHGMVYSHTAEESDYFGLATLATILFSVHNAWFVAKALKSVEEGGEVGFRDYVGDFFLIFLLPIGIWILQPRLNVIAGSAPPLHDEHPNILDTDFR